MNPVLHVHTEPEDVLLHVAYCAQLSHDPTLLDVDVVVHETDFVEVVLLLRVVVVDVVASQFGVPGSQPLRIKHITNNTLNNKIFVLPFVHNFSPSP